MNEHESAEIDMLLPLYAAGRLSPADRRKVAAALAADAALGARLDRITMERAAAIDANETIRPPKAALSRLMESLEAEAARRPAPSLRSWGRGAWSLTELLAGLPRGALTSAAALMAAAVLGAAIALAVLSGQPGYQMAGGETAEGPSGPLAIVQFADGASVAGISEALAEAGASIVSGPRGGAFFEIRFAAGDGLRPAEERLAALAARRDIIRSLTRTGE